MDPTSSTPAVPSADVSLAHPRPAHVAVLIVSYNATHDLRACLRSVLDSDDGPMTRRVVVVDNASTDGSADRVAAEFPGVELVRSATNVGFAGGNNLGWDYLRRSAPDVDYLVLLNQDTVVADGWLRPLVDYLEGHPVAGCAQAKVTLYPRTDLLNTAGNVSHFLGFGFTTGYNQPDGAAFEPVRAIDFPSGAAFAVRADAIRRLGLFDPSFFLYLEDADLGWKLRQAGYACVCVPTSVVHHKYAFNADYRYYHLLERNRWILLATYYRTPTLLLLLPIILAMEAGQALFAWRQGVLRKKLAAWGYFLNARNVGSLLRRRREAQRNRRIGDREFVGPFLAEIEFPELRSALLRRVGNPLLCGYWKVAKQLIWW